MKWTQQLLVLGLSVSFLACSSASDSVSGASSEEQSQSHTLVEQQKILPLNQKKQEEDERKMVVKGPHDGIYVFDVETYKSEQLKHENSIFKKMKPKDVEQMMKIFRPFKIDIQGELATATFAHDVIKGKLTKLEENKLHMIPLDKQKSDQTVTLLIEGNQLVLDPGKKETDKMYFKRFE